MPLRRSYINLPTDVVRMVVIVQEVGSLSKAADALGLSQPAVSSQMKRIEAMMGGPLFLKTPNGSQATELGLLVISQCRKMLQANDQMLAIAGGAKGNKPLRFGLSPLLVREFLTHHTSATLSNVQIVTDNSAALAQKMLDGHLDVACLLDGNASPFHGIEPFIKNEFVDELVWVRSKDFVLSPGSPVPIVMWSRSDAITRALEASDTPYVIAFSGEDYDAKRAAVEAGLGLTALPKRQVPEGLVLAKEYYLPKLPNVRGMLCARPELDARKSSALVRKLIEIFFEA